MTGPTARARRGWRKTSTSNRPPVSTRPSISVTRARPTCSSSTGTWRARGRHATRLPTGGRRRALTCWSETTSTTSAPTTACSTALDRWATRNASKATDHRGETIMTAISNPPPAETVTEPDGRVTELFDLPPDEATLLRLFKLLFEEHAGEIVFGPCIQGAVFEIHVDQPAELTMLDGYLTVDFGTWHFHLCIGEHRATTGAPCPPELARHRQVKR